MIDTLYREFYKYNEYYLSDTALLTDRLNKSGPAEITVVSFPIAHPPHERHAMQRFQECGGGEVFAFERISMTAQGVGVRQLNLPRFRHIEVSDYSWMYTRSPILRQRSGNPNCAIDSYLAVDSRCARRDRLAERMVDVAWEHAQVEVARRHCMLTSAPPCCVHIAGPRIEIYSVS